MRKRALAAGYCVALLWLMPVGLHAQFNYTTNDGTFTITGYTGSGGAVTIPESIDGLFVTSIGPHAFGVWSGLTSVTIPVTVTSIQANAFADCGNLTSVSIPNSVTNLGTAAFYNCVALTRVAIPGSIAFIQDYAFAECYRLAEVDMSPGVTRIGECSFRSCPITNVAIPEGVTNIGSAAFQGCHRLTRVGIPGSAPWIGERAFSDCLSLEDLNLSEGVAWIGEAAFQSCRNLDRVTIPGSVTNVGYYEFAGCSSLTNVYFTGDAPSGGKPVFDDTYSAVVYYLSGTVGWTSTFVGRPTVLWNPTPQVSGSDFGVGSSGFGFTVAGTPRVPFVLEASASIDAAVWIPLQTNSLGEASLQVNDPEWASYPMRFYRLRSP